MFLGRPYPGEPVRNPLLRPVAAGLLATLVGAAPLVAPVATHAQTNGCAGAGEPEDFGPTDVSATSGNQALSVGLNPKATVTVLKWPSPSFYDQVKYRTTDRARARFGALPNEGALVGLAWRGGNGNRWTFEWLRQWPSSQRWADDDGDVVVTTFRRPSLGLSVTVRDLVAHDEDVFYRQINVSRTARSRVRAARVVGFANFNPVFTKTAQAPNQDWCSEEDNDSGATYNRRADAVVHARSGTDESTGAPSGAALTMGFLGRSDGHSIGVDTYQAGEGTSAYDDAKDGKLSGESSAPGQADAALLDELSLAQRRNATTTLAIAAAVTPEESLSLLDDARERSATRAIAAKSRWWRSWLSGAKLPKNAPRAVVDLAKRSLIVMRQATDPAAREDNQGGLIVASISTQPPLGLDWIRNGGYVNRALHESGHPEMVRAHDIRYAELQATATSQPRGAAATPTGNWAQNYYSDGVVGGPVPYEIDATGLGIWTLWDHFVVTGDRAYLTQREEVYEAIQRSAQYLTDICRDPATGLHCPAPEGNGPNPTQTLVGAQAVWLGLGAASDAATELGTVNSQANAERWSIRQREVGDAIRTRYFDEDCSCFTTDPATGGVLLWPVRFLRYGSDQANAQAEVNFRYVSRGLRGVRDEGGEETQALLGNAFAWARSPRDLRRVRTGLRWVADVPTTDATLLLGEGWVRRRGQVVTVSGQPHVPTHAMFYLAALEAYGKERYSFR
jgi:GH15 family glucan-1,4-alpha-glucosidase